MNQTPRQRPGRFRRWLLRPAVWALLAAAALACGVLVALTSDWFAERLRGLAAERLSSLLEREVAIESLRLELLPLSVEASGVTVAGSDPGGPPFATARRLVVEGDPRALLGPRPTLRRLAIEGLWVDLRFAGDGSHNLPLPQRLGGGGGRGLTIETLEVRDGELALDDRRLPLALAARLATVRLLGEGPGAWVGVAAAQEVETRIAELEPYLGGVTVKLRLAPGRLAIVDARANGPELALRASGDWRWGEARTAGLDLEASASGALLERLGWSDQIEGPLDFSGRLQREGEAWDLRGRLASANLVLAGRPLEEFGADLALDGESLRLDPFAGVYRGGPVSGDVVVDLGAAPTVAVRAHLDGSRVEEALSDQGIVVVGLVGTVGGRIEYRCLAADPMAGDGWAELELAASETPLTVDLPLSGAAPLRIQDGVIESRALHLVTPVATFDGEGYYDLRSGRGLFDFGGAVEDAGRLLAALDPARPAEVPVWRPTAGAGRVDGTLDLAPGGWSLLVEPDLVGVEAPGYSADRLRGALTLSTTAVDGLELELLGPGAELRLTGRVPFAESEALELAIEARGWPAADFQPWLPWPLPLAGAVSGSVHLAGSLAALTGSLDAAVTPVEAFGVAADRLVGRLRFGPEGTIVERLALTAAAGEVSAAGSLGPGDAGFLDLTLDAAGLDLGREPFVGILGGPLTGRLDVAASVQGTWAEPALAATLRGHHVALGERVLGEAGETALAVGWRAGELRVDGDLLGVLEVAGGGSLDARGSDLRVTLSSEDPVAIAQLLTEDRLPTFPGRLRGELAVSGAWTQPPGLAVVFTGSELDLEIENRKVSLLEPASVRWGPEGLQIESLYLGELATASELFLHGLVPPAGGSLDLRLQASLAGALVEPWLPGWRIADGHLEGIGAIRGTAERLRITGQAEIAAGSIVIPGFPGAIETLSGWLLFDPGLVTLDSVGGRFGGGQVRAAGSVALDTLGAGPGYELQLAADGVDVRYPEGWLLRGDFEASLASTPEGQRLRGSVALDRAFYVEDVPLGLGQLLQGLFVRRALEVEETDELLAATELDLLVRGPRALRVRNNVAQLDGDVDLALRGTLARPVLFGTVVVTPGGTLVYADNEYEVERGELTFANPFRIEPVIDLAARTELRDYDVTLTLAGTIDQLEVALASDPPLADLDVLTLLAGGEAAPIAGPSGVAAAQVTAAGLLYGQAAAVVGRRVGRLFGLDKFRIDPLTGSSGDLSSARFTVGERLSRDLYATYSYDPSTSEQQILQLEWQAGRGLTVVATQNGDGSYAIDVRAEKSF